MHGFSFYDIFILSFVQLVLSTGLLLSPARDVGTRSRWTGSRITEVLLGALATTALSVVASVIAAELWGLPAGRLETAAALLVIFSIVVISLRPDCNIVGQIFYSSYAAAGLSFLAYAALIAADATRSTAQALTFTVLLLLELAALVVWNSNVNYVSDVLCRSRHSRPPSAGGWSRSSRSSGRRLPVVTVSGTNFTGVTAVDFGLNAATFIVNSPTIITATAPSGTGAVDVTVTTGGGTSATSPRDQFTQSSGTPRSRSRHRCRGDGSSTARPSS